VKKIVIKMAYPMHVKQIAIKTVIRTIVRFSTTVIKTAFLTYANLQTTAT